MSRQKTVSICYTDIRGSTELNRLLGNDRTKILKNEHFRIAEELVKNNSGKPVKRLGDGILCYFSNPAHASQFASQLQWIESDHPGLVRWHFEIKIGLTHGHVIVDDDDIMGTGANLGARVGALADVGQILFDKRTYEALESQWGREKVDSLCFRLGEYDLKDAGKEQIWEFNWKKLNLEEGLVPNLVREHLTDTGFEIQNNENVPISKGGKIFWPVVPRNVATAIHRGQLEAIKLLSFCGWTTDLFIADITNLSSPENVDKNFEERINEYAESIGVSINQVVYMSKVFTPNSSDFPRLQSIFKELATTLEVKDIFEYEGKSYEDKKELVSSYKVLDFLRPAYTVVALLMFIEKNSQEQIMVIAGNDERVQWMDVLARKSLYNRMNIIFNPELKKGKHLMRQTKDWPYWLSKKGCLSEMEGTNLAEWLFKLFVLLPKFPSNEDTVKRAICDRCCKKKDCGDPLYKCEKSTEIGPHLLKAISDKFAW